MELLKVRNRAAFDRCDGVVLCLYVCLLALGVHHHAASMDEAQAWLIARDSSLHELLFRRLHYEGAPALWPLLLWAATRLHLPYTGINWLGAALAVPGVYLLLRFAPLPRVLRWLLPFTFFIQYQYAVIARPYVLLPTLLFSLATVYTLRPARSVLFALLAGLLANISAHGAIVACLLEFLYLRDLREWGRRDGEQLTHRRIAASGGVFALLLLLAAAVAFPAPDVSFPVQNATSKGKLHAVLLRLMPEEPPAARGVSLDPPLEDANAQTAARGDDSALANFIGYLVPKAVVSMNVATYPIAQSNILAVAFLACWSYWLWSRFQERFVAAYLAAIFLSAQIWIYSHHAGLFAIFIVATVWITMALPARRRGPQWIDPAFMAVSLIVVLLQIGWTVHCLRAEARGPYDPGLATESLLAEDFAGKRIAGFGFETVSTQPYAPSNLYFNWRHTYYLWSSNDDLDLLRTEVAAMRPDAVVVAEFIGGREDMLNQWFNVAPAGRPLHGEMIEFWRQHGYRETHRFCGGRYMRMGVANTLCEVIMEPEPAAKPGIAAPAGGAAAPSSPKMR